MYAPAASRRRAPCNEVLLVERVLHVDYLDLQASNQLIDLDRCLPVCFLLLHLDGCPNNGLLLAADFSFQHLDALLLLVKFTKSLLVHALDLAHHILICLLLTMHVMMLAHNVIESIESGIFFSLEEDFGLQCFLTARAHGDLHGAFPAVLLPRVGHLPPLQLLEDVFHLPLDDGVLLSGLHQELLRLEFQAVDLSEVL